MSDQSRHIAAPSHQSTLCGLTPEAVGLRGETITHKDYASCAACIAVRASLSKLGAKRVASNARALKLVRTELKRLGYPGHDA